MLRRKTTRTTQARELARLFAALDAAGAERRAVPRERPARATVRRAELRSI